MKRVARAWTLAEIGHFRNVLEQKGIDCFIKNEQLAGALGDVPFLECQPELWVLNDADQSLAERLIEESKQPVGGHAWRCRHCGEDNEAEFGACWNCGRADSGEAGS